MADCIEPCWNRISDDAKKLLAKMLQYEPEKRISAAEALNDPWITKYDKALEGKEDVLKSTINNLRGFRTQMTLQKAVLAYIASQELSKDEEKKIKDAFDLFDTDKNGSISQEELRRGYEYIYKDVIFVQKEVERIIRRLDINQNGSIDYNGKISYCRNLIEFLMANLEIQSALSKEKLKAAFEYFDTVWNNNIVAIRTRTGEYRWMNCGFISGICAARQLS